MIMLRREEIEEIVLTAIKSHNELQDEEQKIAVTSTALLFGGSSPLDSLGIVTLTMDVEDSLAERGLNLNLSNDRAMSSSRSPYRSVDALVDFIVEQLTTVSSPIDGEPAGVISTKVVQESEN